MSQQKYPKAYEAYQQAVYRDGRNPTFWCSIGVLYYQINQYRDALDAYSRAIRLNPNISEVWYDLGTLYESCNNQTNDALDAYTRAADLDPTNVHIKARLALLKGQSTPGMPNQGNAPLPQDVHPQAYQPGALGGPPGPQWGTQPQSQPPPGPPPPALNTPGDWNRRLADIQTPGAQPQTLNPYDPRERIAQHVPVRQPSPPRQEPPRQYQEPQRPPPPSHRGLSPSPKVAYNAPAPYQPAAPVPPQHGLPQHQPPPPPPNRVANPNFAPQPGSAGGIPPIGMGAPPAQAHLPPFGPASVASPAPEIRPLVENTTTSPNGTYPRQAYHHPTSSTPTISSGAPPPTSAMHAAEAAAREREGRPPTAPPTKRHREWEDDSQNMGVQKKQQNDESRSRLDDASSRRPSPPDKAPTPPRTVEEPRPTSEAYRPSEAAHHPPLPPMQSAPQPSPRLGVQTDERPQQSTPAPPPQAFEPAARKMEVDENYDDSGDEDKKAGSIKAKSERNSPRSSINGAATAPSSNNGNVPNGVAQSSES